MSHLKNDLPHHALSPSWLSGRERDPRESPLGLRRPSRAASPARRRDGEPAQMNTQPSPTAVVCAAPSLECRLSCRTGQPNPAPAEPASSCAETEGKHCPETKKNHRVFLQPLPQRLVPPRAGVRQLLCPEAQGTGGLGCLPQAPGARWEQQCWHFIES